MTDHHRISFQRDTVANSFFASFYKKRPCTMLKEAIIRFAGSFQCRLGTNPDPTTTPDTPAVSSPTDPFGDIRRPAALGWTFPYSESRFDGIIRCQQPVELRNALIDPFEPVKVTGIEVKPESLGPLGFELPFQPVPVDPLLGLPVSLGEKAYFLSSVCSQAKVDNLARKEKRQILNLFHSNLLDYVQFGQKSSA
ncbi:hypothetical protein LX87_05569 [Larkinella arboricola]|uniref:Uncharacterized protein n=1 Tax=Larkinella arboricola TaxID=643671 RepID=A0A327WIZ8_LARAB|nr:hypothetical protein [Larkinella arboricola]RAJ90043.1 hypothetical protein LX87_05569 [Larkinella arboricola]